MRKTVDQIVDLVLDVALFVLSVLNRFSSRRKKSPSSSGSRGDAQD